MSYYPGASVAKRVTDDTPVGIEKTLRPRRIRLEPRAQGSDEVRNASQWMLQAGLGDKDKASRMLAISRREAKVRGSNVRVVKAIRIPRPPKLPRKPITPTEPTKPTEIGPGVKYLGPGQVGMRGRMSVMGKGVLHQGVAPRLARRTANSLLRPVKTSVVKRDVRHYDPEGDRRFKQGAGAAGLGLSGAAGIGLGAHGIARDTSEARSMIAHLGDIKVGRPPGKPRAQTRGANGKMRSLTDAEKAAEAARHAEALEAFHRAGSNSHAVNQLRGLKGMHVIRGRNAAAIAAGSTALTAAGRLARQRHDERWN